MQMVIPTTAEQWYDTAELRDAVMSRHGRAGATCPDCGVWRWLSLPEKERPQYRIRPSLGNAVIAASPEWFGDGWLAYREILVRRDLAEVIAHASPRDFEIRPMQFAE
jgi:hypothetical protein